MTYIRELEHAKRDAIELSVLLMDQPLDELTVKQIAQAIGLADTAHRALLRAIGASHCDAPAPPAITSRRGLELIGRTAKAGPQA